MILEFSVENYLSIKDKVALSMEATSSGRLAQNMQRVNDFKILKSAAIYGPNASGKSNIVKALAFLSGMVKTSHNFNIDNPIPRIPFKLDDNYEKKPSKFDVVFLANDIKYQYGFSCDSKQIIDEYLYYWPKGRITTVFSRKNDKFAFTSDKKQQKIIQKQMTPNVLYLSRATQLGYGLTKIPYEFIASLTLNLIPFPDIFTKIETDPNLTQRILEILKKSDFGRIDSLNFKKVKGRTVQLNFDAKVDQKAEPPKPVYEDKEMTDIKFIHTTGSGKKIEFSLVEESGGTQKMIFLLPYILDILDRGGVLIIDELETSLHPSICWLLIKMFNNKSNHKAQLIFTTHNTNFLNGDEFRKDQLFICSKKPDQSTHLESFADYDLRDGTNFERAYLDGRIGGMPFVSESLIK